MAVKNTKIVQALIQALIEVSDKIIEADDLADMYKAKYQALSPDLTGTDLTPAQLSAIMTFITDLNTLRNSAVVTTVKSKDVPSQGTGALG